MPSLPVPQLQEQHYQQAPPSDIQLGGQYANESEEVPSAMVQDARGNDAVPQDEEGEPERQEEQPETLGEEHNASVVAGN